jgi:AraC-like DNA-binding protein
MARGGIPVFEMSGHGAEALRRSGIVSLPFMESLSLEPRLADPHAHDFFQFALVLGRGRLMLDFREADVDGATLLFLSPGQVHTIRPENRLHGNIVSFTREFFDLRSAPEGGGSLADTPFFHAAGELPWLSLDAAEDRAARGIFEEIQNEFDRAEEGADIALRALLRILFVRASRWYAARHGGAQPARSSQLTRAFFQELARHGGGWRAVGPYAKQLGVTANHLNDVIAAGTGKPAGAHIREARLLEAKRLLLYSDLSVAEIGYQLGFKDPSYFGRFFRRHERLTPAEFRRGIREKYQN